MKRGLRILLVDDHSLVRDGVEAILRLEKDIEHISHAATAAEALVSVKADMPDLILLDRRMPDGDGFDLLLELQKKKPQPRVIMMTASAMRQEMELARSLGAAGHLPKTIRRAALIEAIHSVLAGGTCFESAATTAPLLSPRELQVLENLRRGLSNQDISRVLEISVQP